MCSATRSLRAVEKALKKYCSKLNFNIRPHVIFNSIPKTRIIIDNVSSAFVHSEDTEILELTQVRYHRLHRNYKKKKFIHFGLVFSGLLKEAFLTV